MSNSSVEDEGCTEGESCNRLAFSSGNVLKKAASLPPYWTEFGRGGVNNPRLGMNSIRSLATLAGVKSSRCASLVQADDTGGRGRGGSGGIFRFGDSPVVKSGVFLKGDSCAKPGSYRALDTSE